MERFQEISSIIESLKKKIIDNTDKFRDISNEAFNFATPILNNPFHKMKDI